MKGKYYVWLFSMLISVLLLTGCSDKEHQKENAQKKAKGRYMETELEIPKKNDQTSIITQTILQDGTYVVYTADVSDSNSFSITRYQYDNKKADWKKESPQWLQEVSVEGTPREIQIMHGEKDREYLYWEDKKGASLCHSKDGKSRDKLTVEGWNEKRPDGIIMTPFSVTMLDNGMFAARLYEGCYVYDIQTGKKKKQIEENDILKLTKFQNKLVAVKGDDGEETTTGLSIYNTENLEAAPKEIALDTPVPLDTAVCLNKEKVILANKYGVHVLINDTSTWQTVVDGSLNSMYIPNIYCDSVLQDAEDNYYIFYKSSVSNEEFVMEYQFDKTVNALPSHELSIYTLKENPILYAAVNEFRKKYNDYKVTVRIAMTEDSEQKKEDYIRSLNTELLSGNGCDLLILDGLPLDSYIEKGALSDLSSIIDPLMEKKELLPNVVSDYYKDNKIYALPTRIKLPMLYGKADAIASAVTLDKLAVYAKENKGKPLFGEVTYEYIVSEYLPCYMHKIKMSDKKINIQNLKSFLKDIKILFAATGYRPEKEKEYWLKSYMNLPIDITICKDTSDNLVSEGLFLSFTHFVHGDFTTIENSYEPSCIIGVNKSSKQQDTAKAFIQCILSHEVQKVSLEYVGYPVKVETLNNLKPDKWWDGDYPITYKDGKKDDVPLRDISETDRKKIIDYCKTVTEQAYVEDNILKAISEGGKDYILKNEPIDKAVEKIQNKLSLYNQE